MDVSSESENCQNSANYLNAFGPKNLLGLLYNWENMWTFSVSSMKHYKSEIFFVVIAFGKE